MLSLDISHFDYCDVLHVAMLARCYVINVQTCEHENVLIIVFLLFTFEHRILPQHLPC